MSDKEVIEIDSDIDTQDSIDIDNEEIHEITSVPRPSVGLPLRTQPNSAFPISIPVAYGENQGVPEPEIHIIDESIINESDTSNSDDGIEVQGSNYPFNDDVIHINTRRRRRSFEDESRRVRFRSDNEDDDIQIVRERQLSPQEASPFGSPPERIGNQAFRIINVGADEFRRSLLQRIHDNDHRVPQNLEGPLINFINGLQFMNRQGQSARDRRRGDETNARNERNIIETLFGDDSDDPDYDDASGAFPFIEELRAWGHWYNDEDVTTAHILERIERDNETMLDKKLKDENKFNRAIMKQKRDAIKREQNGYSANISPGANIGCELCGITLGEGIPTEFKANLSYSKDLKSHSEDSNCIAPWFCFKQITDVDKDLSKRVFLNRCGHLYCGRCIKNIGNRPRVKRGQKAEISIDNPNVFAPKTCVAPGCEQNFRGKKTFTELYF